MMIRYEATPERVTTNPELMQTQLVPSEEAEKVGLKTRRRGKEKITIGTAKDVVEIVKKMEDYDREHVKVIYLDTRLNVIGVRTATIGTLNMSIIDPSSIYKGALLANADSIITVHNHPSGDSRPSDGDIEVTNRIAQAGKILGIGLRDHVIIGKDGHTSMREKGMIPNTLLINPSNPNEVPEIRQGIRIEYMGRDGKFRSNIVVKRRGNELTVKDALGKKRRVHLERVIGYWPPRVKASPKNLIKINPMPKEMQKYNLALELQKRGVASDLVDLEAEVDETLTYPENLMDIMQQYAPTAPLTRLRTGDIAALEEKTKAEFCASAEEECSMGIEEACRAFEEYTCTTKPEPIEIKTKEKFCPKCGRSTPDDLCVVHGDTKQERTPKALKLRKQYLAYLKEKKAKKPRAFRRPRERGAGRKRTRPIRRPIYRSIARLKHGKRTYQLVMMRGRPAVIISS